MKLQLSSDTLAYSVDKFKEGYADMKAGRLVEGIKVNESFFNDVMGDVSAMGVRLDDAIKKQETMMKQWTENKGIELEGKVAEAAERMKDVTMKKLGQLGNSSKLWRRLFIFTSLLGSLSLLIPVAIMILYCFYAGGQEPFYGVPAYYSRLKVQNTTATSGVIFYAPPPPPSPRPPRPPLAVPPPPPPLPPGFRSYGVGPAAAPTAAGEVDLPQVRLSWTTRSL